jgi:hypothetical protein
MEVTFVPSWEFIAFLVAIIVIAGSVVAIVFRRMQARLQSER